HSICDTALKMFNCIPQTGNISGFSFNSPLHSLTTYPSQAWFSSTHISHHLDLLWVDLIQVGLGTSHEVVDDFFFIILHKDYFKTGKDQVHWTIGEDLSSGTCKLICGIANVDKNHWVAIAVNGEQRLIFYSDSNGGRSSELVNALKWWISVHTKVEFAVFDMPVTWQADEFSCRPFALNAVGTFVLP
ncbi:hypothetical protein BDQ17DRAFT_1181232, partial [Cyathus striatus]